MTDAELTDDDLRLVVRHGSGKFIRAVAAVRFAKRRGKMDELEAKIDEEVST